MASGCPRGEIMLAAHFPTRCWPSGVYGWEIAGNLVGWKSGWLASWQAGKLANWQTDYQTARWIIKQLYPLAYKLANRLDPWRGSGPTDRSAAKLAGRHFSLRLAGKLAETGFRLRMAKWLAGWLNMWRHVSIYHYWPMQFATYMQCSRRPKVSNVL